MLSSSMMLSAAAPPASGNPLAFFSVAATVIPLLYLALAYQARTFEGAARLGLVGFYYTYVTAFIVATGEAIALHVLSTQHPTADERHFVADVLLILGGSLLVQPLAAADEDGGRARLAAWYATAGVITTVCILRVHTA